MFRYGPLLSGIALALAQAATPAAACTLSITTPGALDLADDKIHLGSSFHEGRAAVLTTILPALTGVTIDIGAPTVFQAPGNYNYGSSTVEVAYTASVLGVVHIKTQGYTTSATSFPTGLLSGLTATLVMDNRITNTAGFPSGDYKTRTIVTCHP